MSQRAFDLRYTYIIMFGVSVPTFRLKRVSCKDSGIFFVIVECR